MSEPRFCYRHATRIAKRKCFQCRRPLCPECQVKLDHHLFCSELCHKDHLRSIEIRPNRPYLRYSAYASLFLLFSGLVYFGLLADAFYSGGDKHSQASVTQMVPSLPVDTAADTAKVEDVAILRPINGMKSPSQKIEVEGRAPANAVVAVYLNGSLVESTVAHDGHYRFPAVFLTKHANVLQTRYYSGNGSSNFSPAIMVLYQEPLREGDGNWKFFQNAPDNVARGNLNRKELVLTFDGGSDANSCENILKVLRQYKIRSTMFLTGEFIEKFPELTRLIAAEHEVGNHTYSHAHLTTYAENAAQRTHSEMTREELHAQLRKTEELYYRATGKRMVPLWRAPYGEHNLEIRKWAAELGYTHVAWTANPKTRQNLDSLDWVPNSSYPGYFPALLIKDRILSFGQNETEQANGGIVLMHLGSQRPEGDRLDQWLPEIIKAFQSRGYGFITASDLVDRLDLLPTNLASKQ